MSTQTAPTPIIIALKNLFSPQDWPWALLALRQDRAIWEALSENATGAVLGAAALRQLTPDLKCWTPAALGFIAQAVADGGATSMNMENILAAELPNDLLRRIEQDWQAWTTDPQLRTASQDALAGGEQESDRPADALLSPATRRLATFARLALALRERFRQNSTWRGLLDGLELDRPETLTVLACFYGMIPEPERLLATLLGGTGLPARPAAAMHVFLCQPRPESDQAAILAAQLEGLTAAVQLATLRQLSMWRPALAIRLAEMLLTKEGANWLEDPLEGASEDLGRSFERLAGSLRVAQAYQLAGQSDRAVPLLAEGLRTLRRLRGHLSAGLARAVAGSQDGGDENWRETARETSLEAWRQAVQLAPDTLRYSAGFVNALIAAGKLEDARSFLGHHANELEQDAGLALCAVQLAQSPADPSEAHRRLQQVCHLVDGGAELEEQEFVALSGWLKNAGMVTELAAMAQAGLQRFPLSAPLLALLAPVQLNLGHAEGALTAAYTLQALADAPADSLSSTTQAAPAGGDVPETVVIEALEALGSWPAALNLRLQRLAGIDRPGLDELYALMRSAENAGQLQPLESASRQVLQSRPDDLAANRALALVARERGDFAQAAAHYTHVIRLAPEMPDVWLALVEVYRLAGQEASAMDALRAAAQAVPEAVEIHKQLGDAYLAHNQPTQALTYFRRAAALSSSAPIVLRLGKTLLQLGHNEEAARVLGPSVQDAALEGCDPEAIYAYARARLNLGKFDEAIPLLLEVIRKDPEAVEPCLYLGRALIGSSEQPANAQRAVPFLQRMLELNPDGTEGAYIGRLEAMPALRAEARALLAEAYAAAGENAKAMDAFRRAMDDPGNRQPATQTRLSAGLGMVALKLDQPEMAVAALQEAAQSEPSNPALQRSLSEAYLASGLVQDSLQAAGSALALQPENTGLLGWFIRQAENLIEKSVASGPQIRPQILKALTTAIRLEPDRPDLLLRLGRSHLEDGNETGALDAVRQLSRRADRLKVSEAAEAARMARKLGDPKLAARLLQGAVTGRSNEANKTELIDAYSELSLAQQEAGNLESAQRSAEGALALNEKDPELHLRVADVLAAMDRPAPALERLNRAIELAPRDARIRHKAVDLLCRGGRWSAALEMADDGLAALEGASANAENAAMRRSLNLAAADLAHATLRPRQALAYLQAGLSSDDPAYNFYDPVALRAEVALELGDMEQADSAIEMLIRLDPDAARTQAARARRAHAREDRLERDRCCRRAVQSTLKAALNAPAIEPPSTREAYIAAFLSTAQAAVDSRLWDDAITVLNRLVEIIPETPLAYFMLAKIAVLRGEAQCLCQDLDVVRHAPGPAVLTEEARQAVEKYYAQAQALLGVDFKLETSEDFKKWDDECRKTLGAWMARARVLFRPERDAAQIFETLLRLVPSGADEVSGLIMAYRRCGDYQAGLKAVQVGWQPAFDGKDPSKDHRILVQLALVHPDPVQALINAQNALSDAAEHATNWPPAAMLEYLVARLALSNAAIPTAQHAIQQALFAWPDEPRWQELAARIYLKPGLGAELPDPMQALVHFEAAAALDPAHADNHLAIGQIYLSGGQLARALPALELATQLDPQSAEGWLALAQAQYAGGDLQAAAASAERAAAGFNPVADDRSADARGTQGSAADAPAGAKGFLPGMVYPQLADALLLCGRIALQMDHPQSAFDRAQLVLQTKPDHPEALYLMAHSLEALDRPQEALASLERALPLADHPLSMQIERVQLVRRASGLDAGIAALRELTENYASDEAPGGAPELLALLALWLKEAGQVELALQTARIALREQGGELTEEQRAALNLLIGLYMRDIGQLDQAIMYLAEATDHAPANLEPYLELGRAYQERREYRQALKVYQKAISVAPDDFRSYYNAGLVLKDSKDYLAAEAMLRRAAQVAPNEVTVHRLLGAVVALNLVHNRRNTPIGN